MIPGTMPVVAAGGVRPTLLYASGARPASATTQDYDDAPVGEASTTRYVVVGVIWTNGADDNLTITVNGNTPTQIATYDTGSGARFMRWFGIAVPTGTTVDVSTTASNTGTRLIGVFALDNLSSNTPTDTVFDNINPLDLDIDIDGYGLAIGLAVTSTGDSTWTGLTEVFDLYDGAAQFGSGAAYEADASGNAPLAITASSGVGGVYWGGTLAFR